MVLKTAGFDQVHETETPRVAVDQVLAVIGLDDQVVVAAGLRRGPLAQHHPSRHAEMGEPDNAVVQFRQNVFRAPVEPLDAPALQARRKLLRQGKAQVRPALFDTQEPPASKRPRQPPHHRLDFRQFGHGTGG